MKLKISKVKLIRGRERNRGLYKQKKDCTAEQNDKQNKGVYSKQRGANRAEKGVN